MARLAVESPVAAAAPAQAVLVVENLVTRFSTAEGEVSAVNGISFEVGEGETVGIVGESGSGKSTLARAIVRQNPLSGGSLRLGGEDIAALSGEALARFRRRVQMVFQNPAGSLDPALTVRAILDEPLRYAESRSGRAAREAAAAALLARVRLDATLLVRRPHELSGGQAQRVALARALACEPAVLVCDEAVAALDGTARAEILSLLAHEQESTGLALVFITHDLAVVRGIAHRIAVMQAGRICELADAESLFRQPRHPYTRALLAAVPVPDPAARPQCAVGDARV